jgi:hypothetical protein
MTLSPTSFCLRASLLLALCAGSGRVAFAQVSPAEVRDPQLKSLESQYLPKLTSLNRQISADKFPFRFVLSRYVDVDPKNKLGIDTRGLEFVRFHGRTLLKFSGDYEVAFGAEQLTRNQRADRVFADVIVPVLRLLPGCFPQPPDFSGVGFEISYHVSAKTGKSDYEGWENLVVVMSVNDALRFPELTGVDEKQKVLSASEVYMSGQPLRLALGQADPLPVEEMTASAAADAPQPASSNAAGRAPDVPAPAAGSGLTPTLAFRGRTGPADASDRAPSTDDTSPSTDALSPSTPAGVDALQARYQSALVSYGAFVGATMHQTTSASPSLALFRNSLYLQFTLHNPQVFESDKTSLYKRAALSFDVFLAPHLADLFSRIPSITNLAGLDITVLVSVSSSSSPSEAVEFICPLQSLRGFASYDISNQDLINQGMVIINGVRISLNLQQVE